MCSAKVVEFVQMLDCADIIFTLWWSRGASSGGLSPVMSVNKTPRGSLRKRMPNSSCRANIHGTFVLLFNCFVLLLQLVLGRCDTDLMQLHFTAKTKRWFLNSFFMSVLLYINTANYRWLDGYQNPFLTASKRPHFSLSTPNIEAC